MAAWRGWEADVLRLLGAPVTDANVRFLSGWHDYEESACANNPLNTTLVYGGSTRCNAASVQSYPSHGVGAAATARTLLSGLYKAIVAALRSGDPFSYHAAYQVASNIRTWGTDEWANVYLTLAALSQPGGIGQTLPPIVPPPPAAFAPSVHHGWGGLQRSVNRRLPTALARSQAIRRAVRRKLHRQSRLG